MCLAVATGAQIVMRAAARTDDGSAGVTTAQAQPSIEVICQIKERMSHLILHGSLGEIS